MRQVDGPPGQWTDEPPLLDVLRNADPSRTRNAEMLAELADELLPFLASRLTQAPQPGVIGAAEGNTPPGERTSGVPGARPGHDTWVDHRVSHVQEVPAVVGSFDVNRFYKDLLHALDEHAQRGGTGFGAAVVVKRIAKGYGLAVADQVPLPRPTRAERQQLAWDRKQGRS